MNRNTDVLNIIEMFKSHYNDFYKTLNYYTHGDENFDVRDINTVIRMELSTADKETVKYDYRFNDDRFKLTDLDNMDIKGIKSFYYSNLTSIDYNLSRKKGENVINKHKPFFDYYYNMNYIITKYKNHNILIGNINNDLNETFKYTSYSFLITVKVKIERKDIFKILKKANK